MRKKELEQALEDRINGGAESGVHPSPCCTPKLCRLAPFHEIEILRLALRANGLGEEHIEAAERVVVAEHKARKAAFHET